MNISFSGQTVIVTGGSTGIGASTAEEFGKAGANVVVNYNSSGEAAEKVVQQIKAAGGKAIACQCDVTNSDQVKNLILTTVNEFGGLDILVNNAGSLLERRKLEEMTEELWHRVVDLNFKSIYLVSKLALPELKKSQSGKVINVSSIAARNGGGPGAGMYAATKAAVLTLTKNMAKEFLPYGILVNGVAPGVITTPFHDKFSTPEVREGFKQKIPLGREGKPSEIAYGILFLASPYASYILGETLEINGGMLMD
ncbi:MAG: SDR family NAD(P)-dependent oxidoreductase [Candidatus Cyclobacteriaceae bacterium M3_2C_046]